MKIIAATLALAPAFPVTLARINNPPTLPGGYPTNPPECFDSTTLIYQVEKSIALLGLNSTAPRVYNLCTETTYPIGEIDPTDGSIPDDTMFPITFFNPNAHVQCGNFGVPDRNCILEGGPLQVQVTRPDRYYNFWPDPGYSFVYIDNVMIKGLTLQNGVIDSQTTYGYNVQGNHPGELTIEECVFHANANWGNVWAGPKSLVDAEKSSGMPSAMPSDMPSAMPSGMPSAMPSDIPTAMPSGMPSMMPSVSSMPTRNSTELSAMPSSMPSAMPSAMPSGMPSAMPSVMPSVANNTNAARRLNEVVDTERHLSGHTDHLTVYVDRCEFHHNTIAADSLDNSFGTTFAGLVLNGGQQVHVRDSLFMENDFNASILDYDATFMIGASPGSTMELRRNCFMDNSVSLAPVIFDSDVTDAGTSNNYAVNTTFGFSSTLLTCPFLMKITGGGALVDTDPFNLTLACTPAGATECERNAPTSAPTDSPTKKPTSTSGAFVASGSILTVLAGAASFAFMS